MAAMFEARQSAELVVVRQAFPRNRNLEFLSCPPFPRNRSFEKGSLRFFAAGGRRDPLISPL